MNKFINKIGQYFILIVVCIMSVITVNQIAQARINNGTGSSFTSGVTIGSGSGVWTLGADANNSNAFVISPSSTLTPKYLTITQTGTIGVSSSTPYGLFSVNGLAGGSIPIIVVATSTSANATNTALFMDNVGNLFAGLNGSKVLIGSSSQQAFVNPLQTWQSDNNSTLTSNNPPNIRITNSNTGSNNMQGIDFTSLDTNGVELRQVGINSVNTSHTAGSMSSDLVILTRNVGSYTEKARLLSSGFWGLGTSTPVYQLTVFSASTPQLALSTGANSPQVVLRAMVGGGFAIATSTSGGSTATSTKSVFAFDSNAQVYLKTLNSSTAGNAICYLTGNQLVIAGNTTCITSSMFTKHSITSLSPEESLAEIMKLRPVKYINNEGGDTRYGLIAEEVASVDETLIEKTQTDIVMAGHQFKKGDVLAVDYQRSVVGRIISAIQAIMARLSGLEDRLNDQQAQIDLLQAQINALK